VVQRGRVDHSDSLGAAGRYGGGDVQWMTAGSGLQHAEMFPLLNPDAGNTLELFQIWLNLPARSKQVEPHFRMVWRHDIPVVRLADAAGKSVDIEVIAGALGDQVAPAPPPDSWAAIPENHVAVWNINIQEGASWTMPATEAEVNRTIYVYKGGDVSVQGERLGSGYAADMDPGESVQLEGGAGGCSLLLLQGRPINEPVVQHGPFVMNTREEIQQAFLDYQNTQFGGWPWPAYEHVHPRDVGRFARYADGTEERPKD
jgi:hypothetical protein